nr:hypothetical protein [Comamonas testosteroni]
MSATTGETTMNREKLATVYQNAKDVVYGFKKVRDQQARDVIELIGAIALRDQAILTLSEKVKVLEHQMLGTPVELAAAALQQNCHGAAKLAGWWKHPATGEAVQANPYCFSNKLMLIVSEVSEAMEGDRKNLMDDKLPHRPMREVELADAVIRIFDLAGAYDMDLGGAISEKLAFNAQRPDHKMASRQAAGGKAY